LVTGAAGHIGNNVVRALIQSPWSPVAMVRQDSRALTGLDVETRKGDVLDRESLKRCLEGIDAVIHTAAFVGLKRSEEDVMMRINLEGTRVLLEEASAAGVKRFIHFSSVHALKQEPLDTPLSEKYPLALGQEDHPYDRSKARAEQVVLEWPGSMTTVVLNPTAVLGPNDYKPSRLGQVIAQLAEGRIPALVRSGFDFVDVRDVASTTCRVLDGSCSGQRYLLAGAWNSFETLAACVHEAGGNKPPRMYVPMWLARFGAPFAEFGAMLMRKTPMFSRGAIHMLVCQNPRVSSEKAKATYEHQPRPLKETVQDTLQWWREK